MPACPTQARSVMPSINLQKSASREGPLTRGVLRGVVAGAEQQVVDGPHHTPILEVQVTVPDLHDLHGHHTTSLH